MSWYDIDGQPISTDEAMRLKYRLVDGQVSDYSRIGSDHVGGVWVSTVWLGLDHSLGVGPLELFETMIFGGDYDAECVRYSTKEQAALGHAKVVARIRRGVRPW